MKLKLEQPRLETRLHFLSYRTAIAWNGLSQNTINSENISMFTTRLEKNNFSQFMTQKYFDY